MGFTCDNCGRKLICLCQSKKTIMNIIWNDDKKEYIINLYDDLFEQLLDLLRSGQWDINDELDSGEGEYISSYNCVS